VLSHDSDWSGRSNYYALNTKLEHRGRGAILTFAYTCAKSTDSKYAAAGIGASGFNCWQGFLNNDDPERDYGLSDFDVDHRLVGSFVYNLPFGSGEKFASVATGVTNAVVGGWQVNDIYPGSAVFRSQSPPQISGAQRHAGHQSRGSRRGSQRARAHGPAMVQHRGIRAARPRARWGTSDGTPSAAQGSITWTSRCSRTSSSDAEYACSPVESFNTLNHTQVFEVSTNIASPAFGVVTSARPARINQLGVELLF
jgi:hypothetical protein